MPALLTFISSGLTTVFGYLAAQLGAKYSILLVVIAVYVSAAAAFLTVVGGLIDSVVPAMPSMLQDGLAMLPASTNAIMSAVIATDVAAYAYRQIVIVAGIKARV